MMPARDLNMRTSLKVFCGDYIPEEGIMEISDKYWQITRAMELVNFPLPLPGTKVYGAIQARKIAIKWLSSAAALSKMAMKDGREPGCLLDNWVHEINNPEYKGRKDFSDNEMALVVLSFLFASQDAMSSGLIYGFQHFADHPEVLAKVREEQQRIRGGDHARPMTLEMLDDMPYLRCAIRESLRLMPPVTMVISICVFICNVSSQSMAGTLQDLKTIPHFPRLHRPRGRYGYSFFISFSSG